MKNRGIYKSIILFEYSIHLFQNIKNTIDNRIRQLSVQAKLIKNYENYVK